MAEDGTPTIFGNLGYGTEEPTSLPSLRSCDCDLLLLPALGAWVMVAQPPVRPRYLLSKLPR